MNIMMDVRDLLLMSCCVFLGSMCVCWSQPLKNRQELIYSLVLVHKGVYAPRILLSIWRNVFLFLLPSLLRCYCFYLEHSFCRLQQDLQSVSGQRPVAAESRAASSALHPHRSLHTQTCITAIHTHQNPQKFKRVCEFVSLAAYPACAFETDTQIQMRVCVMQLHKCLVCTQHA